MSKKVANFKSCQKLSQLLRFTCSQNFGLRKKIVWFSKKKSLKAADLLMIYFNWIYIQKQ